MILLPAWKTCLDELELVLGIMPCNATTRWNSTFDMLSFAVEYREAIKQMTSECKNDLWQYELAEEEWAIVRELSDTLKVCMTSHFTASLLCQHSTDPKRCYVILLACRFNLPLVILAMDHINTYFTNAIKRTSGNNPAIQAAMRIMKKMLKHYYLLMDASETYQIAMGEHFVFYNR